MRGRARVAGPKAGWGGWRGGREREQRRRVEVSTGGDTNSELKQKGQGIWNQLVWQEREGSGIVVDAVGTLGLKSKV